MQLTGACTVAILIAGSTPAVWAQTPTSKGRMGLALDPIVVKWTGDLDGMRERRLIRVITVYSKTLYFVSSGTPRGTAYDQGHLLEEALNRTLGTPQLKVQVQFV